MVQENDNDYIARMLDFSTKYTKLVLSNFRYYIHIVGTNVTVKRAAKSEFREALGAAYIFDSTDTRNKEEVFQKKIVINRAQLVNNYKTTVNDIEAYSNENFFKIGDQLEFSSRGINYKYKVTDIDQFDPYNELLYKLTLSGFEEFKNH